MNLEPITRQIDSDGYALVQDCFSADRVREILGAIVAVTEDPTETAIKSSRGTVFAARNLIDVIPDLPKLWQTERLKTLLRSVLGNDYGLVRALYFDKPSHRSWSLPFHKDMTIAVVDNSLPTTHFSKPTRKAGVDHVEASTEILQNMLTLRIHLDGVTNDNGPLQVIPGSHQTGKLADGSDREPECMLANAGDVLAMRPLISHGSGHSNPELEMQRRILHLEFCGQAELPDGFQWQHYVRPIG